MLAGGGVALVILLSRAALLQIDAFDIFSVP